jgi:hypothetical protein
MRFIDDWFPLLVVLQNARFGESEMKALTAGYESYFRRNERYAVLTVSPGNFVPPGAKERKLVADWLSDPRVRDASSRLCVGSGTVFPSAVVRGALTALMWLWKPPSDFHLVSTAEEGLEHCVARLTEEKVPSRKPLEASSREIVEFLRGEGGFEPSLRTLAGPSSGTTRSAPLDSAGMRKGARVGRPPTT